MSAWVNDALLPDQAGVDAHGEFWTPEDEAARQAEAAYEADLTEREEAHYRQLDGEERERAEASTTACILHISCEVPRIEALPVGNQVKPENDMSESNRTSNLLLAELRKRESEGDGVSGLAADEIERQATALVQATIDLQIERGNFDHYREAHEHAHCCHYAR